METPFYKITSIIGKFFRPVFLVVLSLFFLFISSASLYGSLSSFLGILDSKNIFSILFNGYNGIGTLLWGLFFLAAGVFVPVYFFKFRVTNERQNEGWGMVFYVCVVLIILKWIFDYISPVFA